MKFGRKGVTLIEMAVVMAVFSVALLVVAALFGEVTDLYREIDSTDAARREMRKARRALEQDLVLASPTQLNRAIVPASLASGGDGEAIWFLSAVDPATGDLVRKTNGSPFWQRNVLYYLVVLSNLGTGCVGGSGPTGLDDRCPHKVLIRKVLDIGAPTLITDETSEEILAPDVSSYLTRPDRFDVSSMVGGEVESATIVATGLLTFSSLPAPPPENLANQVLLDLRAVSVEDASREVAVGSASLYNSRFTEILNFSIFLRN